MSSSPLCMIGQLQGRLWASARACQSLQRPGSSWTCILPQGSRQAQHFCTAFLAHRCWPDTGMRVTWFPARTGHIAR